MNAKLIILTLLALLVASNAASAANVGVDQLEKLMAQSAYNISSYTYTTSTDNSARYSNATIDKKLEVFKTTEGKVDLQKKSAWRGSELTIKKNGNALKWQGYFVNGSIYLNIGKNWTKTDLNNISKINFDFNQIQGELDLFQNSNMKFAGSENIDGKDYDKFVGRPSAPIYNLIMGEELLSDLIASQIKMPETLWNRNISLNKSGLMDNSNIVLTAWVSKDNSLLKRMDFNSSLTITPQILNISSPDFKITTLLNESTIYNNFGSQVMIALPKEAQNESSLLEGAAWRSATLDAIRSASKTP